MPFLFAFYANNLKLIQFIFDTNGTFLQVELVILPRSIISDNPQEQQNQPPPPPPPQPPQNQDSAEDQDEKEEDEEKEEEKEVDYYD
jgi:hypothetical protein